MLKRAITGVCYVAVLVGFFFLRMITVDLFIPLVYAFSIIGTIEMVKAFGERTVLSQKATVLCFAVCFTPAYYIAERIAGEGRGYMLVCAFIAGIILLTLLVIDNKTTLEGAGCSFICMMYPTAVLGTMLLANDFGAYTSTLALLMIFIVSPVADTFAYLVGRTFKGPKLCPTISPNKTISGAIGGLIGGTIACVVVYYVYMWLVPGFTGFDFDTPVWLVLAVIGLICSVMTEFGDLVESIIKRHLGIKDMGKILPGHGGILDRIDSTLFASMFIYIVFAIFII